LILFCSTISTLYLSHAAVIARNTISKLYALIEINIALVPFSPTG